MGPSRKMCGVSSNSKVVGVRIELSWKTLSWCQKIGGCWTDVQLGVGEKNPSVFPPSVALGFLLHGSSSGLYVPVL